MCMIELATKMMTAESTIGSQRAESGLMGRCPRRLSLNGVEVKGLIWREVECRQRSPRCCAEHDGIHVHGVSGLAPIPSLAFAHRVLGLFLFLFLYLHLSLFDGGAHHRLFLLVLLAIYRWRCR